jgi:flagellar protein FlaG
MALDVSSIQASPHMPLEGSRYAQAAVAEMAAERSAAVQAPADLAKAVSDLQQISVTFNTRLSFSLNEKLDQVVVKVIDNDTDKIVREIPPSELQHVYERIREVIGLLFDESA